VALGLNSQGRRLLLIQKPPLAPRRTVASLSGQKSQSVRGLFLTLLTQPQTQAQTQAQAQLTLWPHSLIEAQPLGTQEDQARPSLHSFQK
jgi:hypothetical protein